MGLLIGGILTGQTPGYFVRLAFFSMAYAIFLIVYYVRLRRRIAAIERRNYEAWLRLIAPPGQEGE